MKDDIPLNKETNQNDQKQIICAQESTHSFIEWIKGSQKVTENGKYLKTI